MIEKHRLDNAIIHIRQIHAEMRATYPDIKMFGVTKEEKEDSEKIHAMLWLGVLQQKPGAYKEADDFIRNAILYSSLMIQMNVMDEHGETIN